MFSSFFSEREFLETKQHAKKNQKKNFALRVFFPKKKKSVVSVIWLRDHCLPHERQLMIGLSSVGLIYQNVFLIKEHSHFFIPFLFFFCLEGVRVVVGWQIDFEKKNLRVDKKTKNVIGRTNLFNS